MDPISSSKCGEDVSSLVRDLEEMRHDIDEKEKQLHSRITKMCEEMKLDLGIDTIKVEIGRVQLDMDKFVSKEVFNGLALSMRQVSQAALQQGTMMNESVAKIVALSEANTKGLHNAVDGKVAALKERFQADMGNVMVAFEDMLEKKAARKMGDADLSFVSSKIKQHVDECMQEYAGHLIHVLEDHPGFFSTNGCND